MVKKEADSSVILFLRPATVYRPPAVLRGCGTIETETGLRTEDSDPDPRTGFTNRPVRGRGGLDELLEDRLGLFEEVFGELDPDLVGGLLVEVDFKLLGKGNRLIRSIRRYRIVRQSCELCGTLILLRCLGLQRRGRPFAGRLRPERQGV